jgi:uncharacterized BrkB/YihY/UPF0761 family membrane protein
MADRPPADAVPGEAGLDADEVRADPTDAAPVMPADASAIVPAEASGVRALVDRSMERVTEGQARLSELIDKNHDRPVIDVGLRFYQRDREAAGTIVGSALAFRLFLFFVPLLLFVVGVLGFVARWIEPADINEAAGLTGPIAEQINTALTQPNSTRWIATIAGLGGMAWAGRSLSKVMVSAACLAWRLPVTTKASLRVIGAVIGLIAGLVVVSSVVNRIREDFGLGAAGLSFVAVWALYGVAWMTLTMLLPRATKDPGALLPGAALVAAVLTVMQAIAQLYLPDRIGRASQLYGAIGATIVTLGWFFFLGRAIVLGMSLDAVIYERFGTISQFVFGLPVVRLLPRKSAWIRSFFDLER